MSRDETVIDPAWLDRVREAPIDPDEPCIDAQHHVWERKRNFPYLLDDLERDVTAGHNIVATVFVASSSHYRTDGPEHLRCVGETEWIEAQAAAYDARGGGRAGLCAAVIAHLDLRHDRGKVDDALDAHLAASPRMRGIRQAATWSDDPVVNHGRPPATRHLYMDPAFRRGLERLTRKGLIFEAYVFHDQMPELIDLARAFPDTPIVCNHMCVPLGQGRWAASRDQAWGDWRRWTSDLAALPNVHVKLGGIGMPTFGFGWPARPSPPTSDELVEAAGRYLVHAIDAFSPARCMFESNFPVDKLGCGYVPLWNAFKKIARRYDRPERAALLHDTARALYRIDVPAGAGAAP